MKFLSTLHCVGLVLLFFIAGNFSAALAQPNVIKFDPQNCKRFTHGFRNIIVLDQRPDTLGTIGYVKVGPGNRYTYVETEGPLSTEIAAYYHTLSEKAVTKSGKDLVVVIYEMMATEDGMSFSKDFAFFRYRAEYFTGQDDQYTSLGMIDTTVEISALDVNAKLMKTMDEYLCGFCQHLLDNQLLGSAPSYTLEEVRQIDRVRQMGMPAYKTKSYPDGIYASWTDFLQLQYTAGKKLLDYRKGRFKGQGIKKNGKPYTFRLAAMDPDRIINPGRIIVFGGIPYKAFEGNFYRMTFADDSNFHFRASTSKYSPGRPGVFIPMVMPGGSMIGIGMLFVVSGAKSEEYDFTINWRTGKVTQGRKIIDPNAKRKK